MAASADGEDRRKNKQQERVKKSYIQRESVREWLRFHRVHRKVHISLLWPTSLDLRQPSSELDAGKPRRGGGNEKTSLFDVFQNSNSFGQMEASAEQKEMGEREAKKNILCT